MRRLLPAAAVLLLASCGGPPPPPPGPPPEPDWRRIESQLASPERDEQVRGFRALLDAPEGTLERLAAMPADGNPGLRHYTAAQLLVTIFGDALPSERSWVPTKGTLELLVRGLEDEREMVAGGAADWGLPVGRFCLFSLELLTGEEPLPRPVNVMPSRPVITRWRRWWHENQAFLVFDAARGVWTVDESARRLGIPLGPP